MLRERNCDVASLKVCQANNENLVKKIKYYDQYYCLLLFYKTKYFYKYSLRQLECEKVQNESDEIRLRDQQIEQIKNENK